ALMAALAQIGAPYRRRSADPATGFDCSGLTAYAWVEAGYSLARNSTQQFRQGDPRNFFTAQAGDLIRYPGHVMMWLGVDNAVVHSPEPGKVVEVRLLSDRSLRRSGFFDPTE
ncbi:MAG: C40 family peptidase, partial [Actinomycetota bacterium]